MENITTKVDKIWFPLEKDLTPEEKVYIRWDSDPIFLAKETNRELNELNQKASKVLNYFKATIIILVLILGVLVAMASLN